MLDDRQIDELERLIVFSELRDLPMILSRAIPLLFSELRLVKATLDSKVNNFLGGLDAVSHGTGPTEEETQGAVREGGVDLGTVHRQPTSPKEVDQADAGRSGAEAAAGERPSGKRGRGRPKGSRNKQQVDARGSQPEVGGQQPEQPRAASGVGVEANARLIEVQEEWKRQQLEGL